tara:strand:+ start:116 stop:448 length:333 start_codon:yes stop_codon:yes gene_type:complete
MSKKNGWIGVDLDGTLAHYDKWDNGKIGKPIPKMVNRVKKWLEAGRKVKIMTARVAYRNSFSMRQKKQIENWCEEHIGKILPVTSIKDLSMIELWDDRAIRVEKNTGEVV